MKWNETVASEARYGDVAERIFGGAEVLWEKSEADYSGSCNVVARMPDGTFAQYAWSYGSCSGCDEWESRWGWDDDADDKVEAEMRGAMATFADADALLKYLDGCDSDDEWSDFYKCAPSVRAALQQSP